MVKKIQCPIWHQSHKNKKGLKFIGSYHIATTEPCFLPTGPARSKSTQRNPKYQRKSYNLENAYHFNNTILRKSSLQLKRGKQLPTCCHVLLQQFVFWAIRPFTKLTSSYHRTSNIPSEKNVQTCPCNRNLAEISRQKAL